MNKSLSWIAAIATLFLFSSCKKERGTGPLITESRNITGFNGVSANVAGKINYTIAPVYKVEIIAQRNILDVLETYNENGHLLIKVRNGVYIQTSQDIVFNISAPAADYLHLSGAGDLRIFGNINTAKLDIAISGSGNIDVPNATVTDRLLANISGSGNINIWAGTASNEELRISGNGNIAADGLAADKVSAAISGSGDIKTKAIQTLTATISGSGSIYYRGNPLVSSHISGSGSLRPL